MSDQVLLEFTCLCAGKVTLSATIRPFTRVGSQVDSKTATFCAGIGALGAMKYCFP